MDRVRNNSHDISGNRFFRVIRLNLFNKLFATGNYRHGTGFKPGLVLLILHWFGRPLFRILIRYEPYLHRIYQSIGNIRK